MRIVFRGNHMDQVDLPDGLVPWSTEYHIGATLELLGHEVLRVAEDRDGWAPTVLACADADLFMWTSTQGYADLWPRAEAAAAVRALNRMLPTVGVHLDLWWGLGREHLIRSEPFFRLGHLFTADGDHDELWQAEGIRHTWMPPGVFGPECVPGTPNPEWASDVAFIGSWNGYGHAEWWPHRKAMLDAARARFGDRLALWPRQGRGAVRSQHLNNLLASVKVVLGDSCFADRSHAYFSDRVFETIGRGGFLVMPAISGLRDILPDGNGVRYYPFGDHAAMCALVEHYADPVNDDERRQIIERGMRDVRARHTYTQRLAYVLDTVELDERTRA